MSGSAKRAQGTKIYIGSGTGSAITITAITKAFHAEVTGTHALAKGDRVTFASVGGMTEINTLTGTVLAVTSTTAFVVDIDSRAFTTYTSGGTATPVTWTAIGDIKSVDPAGASVPDIDVSDLDSVAVESIPGLVDNGEVTLGLNYVIGNPGQTALESSFNGTIVKPFKITTLDPATYSFNAYVKKYPNIPKADVNGVLTGSITLRISGAVTRA